ncbi:uncharacterized protein LOC116337789 isoform X2 [Contarinia nasturtii]|uniref:uncharacterized protein LOC116337789 isoform X2 n=1 Tax=Contarinia nasturtii TaxID=265458 RepID=UPI0012D4655B|nr:uncharacterized protein LOC116337789 isoform X2 [Contarinia nasturtii]
MMFTIRQFFGSDLKSVGLVLAWLQIFWECIDMVFDFYDGEKDKVDVLVNSISVVSLLCLLYGIHMNRPKLMMASLCELAFSALECLLNIVPLAFAFYSVCLLKQLSKNYCINEIFIPIVSSIFHTALHFCSVLIFYSLYKSMSADPTNSKSELNQVEAAKDEASKNDATAEYTAEFKA